MSYDWTFMEIAIIIVICIAGIGLLIFVWDNYQKHVNKRVDYFEDLDQRYDEIINALPKEAIENPDLSYQKCFKKAQLLSL